MDHHCGSKRWGPHLRSSRGANSLTKNSLCHRRFPIWSQQPVIRVSWDTQRPDPQFMVLTKNSLCCLRFTISSHQSVIRISCDTRRPDPGRPASVGRDRRANECDRCHVGCDRRETKRWGHTFDLPETRNSLTANSLCRRRFPVWSQHPVIRISCDTQRPDP